MYVLCDVLAVLLVFYGVCIFEIAFCFLHLFEDSIVVSFRVIFFLIF
jgi:hypothetical protein